MVETKDYTYMTIIAIILLGGITSVVYDTGEELTCRTNKPSGWEIISEHEDYYEAVCPYKTKEPVTALCSEFRSTNSYERYGCDEVLVVPQDEEIDRQEEICHPSPNYGCVEI